MMATSPLIIFGHARQLDGTPFSKRMEMDLVSVCFVSFLYFNGMHDIETALRDDRARGSLRHEIYSCGNMRNRHVSRSAVHIKTYLKQTSVRVMDEITSTQLLLGQNMG